VLDSIFGVGLLAVRICGWEMVRRGWDDRMCFELGNCFEWGKDGRIEILQVFDVQKKNSED
jgi:hypothetical protein